MIEIQLRSLKGNIGGSHTVGGDCSHVLESSLASIRHISEINFHLGGEAASKINSLRKSLRSLTSDPLRVIITCNRKSEYFIL